MSAMKIKLGYALSSEEMRPRALVEQAVKAEAAGFSYALISDHYHPWLDVQGQSSFVWSVLGGIAMQTTSIRIGTGVTCPIMRMHPALVAQAAATVADMMPGRFFLGVGSGENLNEHVVGYEWPPADVRLEMLREAVDIIRRLWGGEQLDYRGDHFIVNNAKLYTRPEQAPELYMAAGGELAAGLAGEIADGLISTSPQRELVAAFGGEGETRPRLGQMACCWARTEDEGQQTAMKYWPTAGLGGAFKQELPLPKHFEEACKTVRPEDVTKEVVCGPNVERHLEEMRKFADAGYDHVYVHQIGPDHDGFFDFYKREVMPKLEAA